MAMLIREEHRLPTLRLRLGSAACQADEGELNPSGPGGDEAGSARPVVLSQIMHGDNAASPWVRTELASLGLTESRSGPWASDPDLGVTPIGGQVAALAEAGEPGRPLWYHIAQDGAALALLPWERMFRQITPVPILRIPNFLEIPYRRAANPCVVVCASAPVGDGPYALPQFIDAVVGAIAEAGDRANVVPTIHVFTDQEALPEVGLILPIPQLAPRVSLWRHTRTDAAREAGSHPAANRGKWLNWIVDSLGGISADIVHFIGPGYLEGDRGAVVLASGPNLNEQRGTMIGAGELVAFFDRVGCTAMAFSNPDMPEWVVGQRALAFELSWLRAGPIMLTETKDSLGGGLAAAYEMLFGHGGSEFFQKLAAAEPLHLCCHPDLVNSEHFEISHGEHELDPAAAYVRNHKAILSATRAFSATERIEQRGTMAAMDFLSSLIDSRGRSL